jgi:tagatose 6-phosphate kinase
MTDFLLSLYAKGTKQAFITNGEKEFYASNHDFIYKVDFPKVDAFDPTGSGDAFTAGIVYGLHYDRVFEDTLKFACALGAVNAQYESVCDVKPDSVEEYKTQVKVQPVGKKMKLVDVTPTA